MTTDDTKTPRSDVSSAALEWFVANGGEAKWLPGLTCDVEYEADDQGRVKVLGHEGVELARYTWRGANPVIEPEVLEPQ